MPHTVGAQTDTQESGYSITIQKFKLIDGVSLSADVPQDGTKAEIVTDDKGNRLDAFVGVSYEIIRVSPMEGTSEFHPVEGINAFSTEVTTDDAGIAHVGNLEAGTYRVTEKASGLLEKVMDPVIVELPLPQRNGEALSDVFLYPKSSIVSPKAPMKHPSEKDGTKSGALPNAASGKERIPQTSGSLGTMQPLYILLFLVLMMGTLGGYYMSRKKHYS